MQDFQNSAFADVFSSYPPAIREKLLQLRELILDTAASIDVVGEIEETLKWNEPSYLTSKTKTGSTIRINKPKASDDRVALYFKCTANLVPEMRKEYPTLFKYEDNRAILFDVSDDIPEKETRRCIALALTYHLNKKLEPVNRWAMVEEFLAS